MYTFEQLMNMSTLEIEVIRRRLKNNYEKLMGRKMELCANVMSLQGLIEKEKNEAGISQTESDG